MACKSFEELTRAARGILGVTKTDLANLLGVHRNTLARWEANGAPPRESLAYPFGDFMENPRRKIPRAPREDCETVAAHYRAWRARYDADATREIPRFESSSSVFVAVIRWRDRSNPSAVPFETRKVGMGGYYEDVEVFDEAVAYRHDVVRRPNGADLRIDAASNGLIEVALADSANVALGLETYANTKGRNVPMVFETDSEIARVSYVVRIFNGFQRGSENFAIKQFDGCSVDRVSVTVDFAIPLLSARFAKTPTARYIPFAGDGEKEIPMSRSADSALWRVEHSAPEPDSRVDVSWSLE